MRPLLLVLYTFHTLESISCQSPHPPVTISSPAITNWGDWHPWEHCPDGAFVIGMQLKSERGRGSGDDTALNGIRLFCALRERGVVGSITSEVQQWGEWTAERSCERGFATGFQLRSESRQGNGDDTAANNLLLKCSDGKDVMGDALTDWGYWTAEQKCPEDYVICGLQTQIEAKRGHRDDTALNNVNMKCCHMLAPSEATTSILLDQLEAELNWHPNRGLRHGIGIGIGIGIALVLGFVCLWICVFSRRTGDNAATGHNPQGMALERLEPSSTDLTTSSHPGDSRSPLAREASGSRPRLLDSPPPVGKITGNTAKKER